MNLTNKLQFTNKPVIDFMHAVYLYGNLDEVLGIFHDRSIGLDKEVLTMMHQMDKSFSGFVKNEIETLSYLGTFDCLLIYYISEHEELITIDQFFQLFQETTVEKLFDYIGWSFLCSYSSSANRGDWLTATTTLQEMKSYIQALDDIVEPKVKDEIIELFEAPEETKMRLGYLFQQFYKKGYKPFEHEIIAQSTAEKERYEKLLQENPDEFFKINLEKPSINGSTSFKYDQYKLYVSYMQQFGYTIFANNRIEKANGTISIGCRNIELHKSKSILANFEKFLKIIADPTRFKIISFVGKDSWYVHALAKELQLTPATIHYHLETLHSLDIVTSFKEGNKVMYKLNTEVTKQYLDYLNRKIFQ